MWLIPQITENEWYVPVIMQFKNILDLTYSKAHFIHSKSRWSCTPTLTPYMLVVLFATVMWQEMVFHVLKKNPFLGFKSRHILTALLNEKYAFNIKHARLNHRLGHMVVFGVKNSNGSYINITAGTYSNLRMGSVSGVRFRLCESTACYLHLQGCRFFLTIFGCCCVFNSV